MTAKRAFNQWAKKQPFTPTHIENCYYKDDSSIPIDECHCDCYMEAIFNAGYNAAKGISVKRNK